MQFVHKAARGEQVWVRVVEHWVLRLVSMGFSMASAHAIRWFFAPLDGVDQLQPAITWTVAIGFGILGYFVSRGLAHRLMNHERIRAYLPICLVVELVEIFCNYALAAAVIQRATWLEATPPAQRVVLTALTYVVLAIIPLVSLLLAVVDMDLERSKHGQMGGWPAVPSGARAPVYTPPGAPNKGAQLGGNQGKPVNGGVPPVQRAAPVAPAYQQGYGAPRRAAPATPFPQGYGAGYGAVPAAPGGNGRADASVPFVPMQTDPIP